MSKVVVIGAGLAGLAAACHLTGRGYEVTVVERADIPGGRSGQLVRDGFTFDTGPDGADHAQSRRRRAGRGRHRHRLRAADATPRPGLPGPLRRRQHHPRPARPGGDAGRDRRDLRPGRRGRVRRLRGLAGAAVRDRDAALHRPQLQLTARPAPLSGRRRRADPAGRLRAPRERGAAPVPRPPTAPAVQLPGHVRRTGAGRRARHLRRDHLHGQHRGGLVPRRWDARHARGPGRRGGEGRRHAALRRDRDRGRPPSRQRRGGRGPAGLRRPADGGRRGLHARPAGRLRPAAARSASAAGRPPRVVLAVGGGLARRRARHARARGRAPQHPLRHRSGARPSTPC